MAATTSISSQACKLLVSVRNRVEALAAVRGGADWIDVKDPDGGSLGAASSSQIAEVVAAVEGQLPVSAALGELADLRQLGGWNLPDLAGVSLVKIGLWGCDDQRDWPSRVVDLAQSLPTGVSLVAVHYADRVLAGSPALEQLLDVASEFGSPALLIDTYDKLQGCLFDYYSPHELRAAFSMARGYSMQCVAAGSLRLEQLSSLVVCQPDVVAVRGAACGDNDRRATISDKRVQQLRHAISKENSRFC